MNRRTFLQTVSTFAAMASGGVTQGMAAQQPFVRALLRMGQQIGAQALQNARPHVFKKPDSQLAAAACTP